MRLRGIARATLLCVGVWLLPAAAHATTIGPDAFGYTATNEVPFSFVNVQPTGTRVLADVDDATVAAAIGFDFNFYGTTFNNLFIHLARLPAFVPPAPDQNVISDGNWYWSPIIPVAT